MRYDSIIDVIGDTPLVRIDPGIHGLHNIDLFAKLEMMNPFGSVKDRAAWSMVQPQLSEAIQHERTVVELSSGNTAKALAIISGMHGLKFKSVTNRMKVPEVKDVLLLLGAEIEELPGQAECLDPTDTQDPLTQIHQLLSNSQGEYLHTDQYYNELNIQAHFVGTGPEIIADLDGRAPGYFIACVGTAGSSTGVARAFRAQDPNVTVLGLVAHKSDFIPGIRNIDEVNEVGLFDPLTYDVIESVTSDEAIEGMLTLNRSCGILGGPTAGAAYAGAVDYLREIDAGLTERTSAVFIVCDRVESYLSYVRKRRPELLLQPAHTNSVASVTEAERDSVAGLEVEAAQTWVRESNALILDLRGSFAFNSAHIEGSVNVVDEVFDELIRTGSPVSPTKPVLLVCPVGEKSANYVALLNRAGHPQARSLRGGIIAWRDHGAKLVSA